jgi:beta-phosphoglucomutase family hydrolase
VTPGPDSHHVLAPGLALIFDMDGVLLDSNPLHREAWAAFNRTFGLETTEAMLERMYGRRNDEIVRDFFGEHLPPAEVEARGAAKERLYRELLAARLEGMLVPGLRAFLAAYRGAPLAVASNAEPENVDFFLDRAGLRRFFRVVIDGHQVRRPKPDPEIYLLASQRLGIRPADCIVFEDSHYGVEAAHRAGMRIVGVSTTHGNLPGTGICVDNFLNGELGAWLADQTLAS